MHAAGRRCPDRPAASYQTRRGQPGKLPMAPGIRFRTGSIPVIFKPTQSTIVFSVSRPGELAPEYRVHHTRAGRFGRFGETEIAEAARELALAFAEKARPR